MTCPKTNMNIVCSCNCSPEVWNKDNSCQCVCGQICRACALDKEISEIDKWNKEGA